MVMKKKNNVIAMLLAVLMVIAMLPMVTQEAYADKYLDFSEHVNGLKDGKIENYIGGYKDYSEARERARSSAEEKIDAEYTPQQMSNKELYLLRKKEAAEARQYEKHRRDVLEEIERLERELAEVSAELFGDAATDYMRAAELDDRKTYIEDRLMTLYEEEESF